MNADFQNKSVRLVGRLSAIVVFALAIAGNAHAQTIPTTPPHIESLDVLLLNVDRVVVGTLAEVRETPGFTITVRETLKGAAEARLQVSYARDFNPAPRTLIFTKTTAGSSDLLLIAIRNTGATVINLSKSELAVMTADLQLLKKPDQVIRAAREILRSAAGATEVMEIPVDAKRVAGTKLANRENALARESRYGEKFSKEFISLVVPVDKRLETLAQAEIRSRNPVLRANGAAALRFFKSDANIAILKSLLDDPGWEPQPPGGLEGSERNEVRRQAYSSLKALGVDVQQPTFMRRLKDN